MLGFDGGDSCGVHAGHLSSTHTDGALIRCINDGIGLHEFSHTPRKEHIAHLLLARSTLRHNRKIVLGNDVVIAVLNQQAAIYLFQIPRWRALAPISGRHNTHIGFSAGSLKCRSLDLGRGDDFDKL